MDENTASIVQSRWSYQLADLVKRECSQGDVVILGVGHPLRGDDYAGSLIAKDLLRNPGSGGRVTVIDAENSPESVLRVLWNTKPRLVVIVDSMEAGLAPGSITLVDLDQTTYPYFSTHNIPMKVLLEAAPGIPQTMLLGIQPTSHEIGEPLSKDAKIARSTIVRELRKIVAEVRREHNIV